MRHFPSSTHGLGVFFTLPSHPRCVACARKRASFYLLRAAIRSGAALSCSSPSFVRLSKAKSGFGSEIFFRGADKLAHPDYTIPSAPLSFREHFDEPSSGTHPLLWQKRIPPEQSTTREMDLWCLFCSFLLNPLCTYGTHPGEIIYLLVGLEKDVWQWETSTCASFGFGYLQRVECTQTYLGKFLCLVHEGPNNTKHFFQAKDMFVGENFVAQSQISLFLGYFKAVLQTIDPI